MIAGLSCLQDTSRRQTMSSQSARGGLATLSTDVDRNESSRRVGSVGTDRPSMQAGSRTGKQSGRAQE